MEEWHAEVGVPGWKGYLCERPVADEGEYREMVRRALRDVRLSGGAEMTAKEVSEVVKKIDPDTVAYREQYKAELINMMKEKEAKAAKKAAEEAKKKGDDDDDDRVSRALRT